MNVRRGFNRLFVLAWIVWVIVAVWWVMDFAGKERAALDSLIYEGEHGRPIDPKYRATESELAKWRKQRDEAAFWNAAKGAMGTGEGLRLVALVLLGLPAIV